MTLNFKVMRPRFYAVATNNTGAGLGRSPRCTGVVYDVLIK
ncbi:MAG: hypothetical protein ACRC62_19615 [Microcoleus sp.]